MDPSAPSSSSGSRSRRERKLSIKAAEAQESAKVAEQLPQAKRAPARKPATNPEKTQAPEEASGSKLSQRERRPSQRMMEARDSAESHKNVPTAQRRAVRFSPPNDVEGPSTSTRKRSREDDESEVQRERAPPKVQKNTTMAEVLQFMADVVHHLSITGEFVKFGEGTDVEMETADTLYLLRDSRDAEFEGLCSKYAAEELAAC